ncbi:RagB/SusD family nutrient uptake outer membrane protein [Sphingobacterium sp. CZ-2]|uniref:RagB/SusD family nutrient uptake outer membrane protein n=1 Tax=Sphingobacterium sp. CZ-2 TaxID=2557994 RepID=UPI001070418F|nr:RagB/SusD family nutrient uptake outer membrane protein [Sphingobacterium sp. CZ-2]QBR12929.1 RagB/SusD family nutrient uptake outer membrane protein [Sphingobacterium sp. CZ-2]
MKTNKILFTGILSMSLLAGCNDDFLDRYPESKRSEANFWQSKSDFELYANTLYPKYLAGFGTDFQANNVDPKGINEAQLVYGDLVTDNAITTNYGKVTNNDYIAYLTGKSGSGGWNWENLRQINYFLNNYKKTSVPESDYAIYLGEINFFKALEYFEKVKLFGDVPWLTKDLQTNSEELYAKRNPRAEVMDSVLMVLDKAIELLPANANNSGRINKDMAYFLKSRIGLYEGTFRKYHGGQNAEKYLQLSIAASEILMNSNKYAIVTGDKDNVYNGLFAKESYAGNKEIVYWRGYNASLTLGSAFSRYFTQNNRNGGSSATRSLVDDYLCIDGQSISTSPLYKGKNTLALEFENRDPRLSQSIALPGKYTLKPGIGMTGTTANPLPGIRGTNTAIGNLAVTGYRWAKWFYDSPTDWARTQNGLQAAPVMRYAEILLNYAEAKAELGQITQDVLDKTINVIKARVAMPALKIGEEPSDPRLDQIYTTYVGYSVSPTLREIRRERRIEMAFENTRWDDLIRWKALKLLSMPVEGMKFNQSEYPSVKVGSDVILSSEGLILPYAQTLPNGRTFNERMYFFPIPIEDLVLNKNLEQNPGWEKAK